jgi:hypothetical protein
LQDAVYLAGKGQSIVRYEIPLPAGINAGNVHVTVSLYLQTLPPYFLADRYQTKTPATRRLEFLANSLETLNGTDYANWKLADRLRNEVKEFSKSGALQPHTIQTMICGRTHRLWG